MALHRIPSKAIKKIIETAEKAPMMTEVGYYTKNLLFVLVKILRKMFTIKIYCEFLNSQNSILNFSFLA